jgi:hypothetical protein
MQNMNQPISAKHQELVTKLREIFQIDRPELDFGIYRILNARASEVNDYLQNRLLDKVRNALGEGAQRPWRRCTSTEGASSPRASGERSSVPRRWDESG